MSITRKMKTSLFYMLFFVASMDLIHAQDINIPKACQVGSEVPHRDLGCAHKYFVIDGKPINPMIIKDLNSWISDGGDQVVSINLLEAQNSNKYYYNSEKYKQEQHGYRFAVEVEEDDKTEAPFGKTFFKYAVEGVTKNGIIVLQTWENGGGSGIFSKLLFVRIRQDMGFGEVREGQLALNRKRILLEKLGEYGLGDRVSTDVKVAGNMISVHSKGSLPSAEDHAEKFTISLERQ